MFRKFLPALLLAVGSLLATTGSASAQHRQRPEHTFGFRCAFDSAQQAEFERNPGSAQEYRAFLQSVAQMSPAEQARVAALPDVTVPVVVHVIHTGGANNITDAQIFDAIRIINRDFNKENADTATIDPRFVALAARPGFQFKLAQKDPSGNCTTGITRTYSTQTSVGDNNIKDVIRWDVNRYLNIWVADNANGAGGYAILPCGGGSTRDGIVIRNTQFASIGRSCGSNFCTRSMTHELGHYFGLPHTWGGSNTPNVPSNCGIDDGISDTPNTIGSGGGCNLNEATCGPVANTENYMDYASCAKMFTIGQRAVMRQSLTLACRANMVSAANLVATGTNDGYQTVPCAPVVAFRSSSSTICEGGTIQFNDYSYNGDLTGAQYLWSFPGGTPATSTLRNPTVQYNTAGTYDVTLTVTTASGSTTSTNQQFVRVLGAGSAERAPYVESFEDPAWPVNPTNADKSWRNESSNASAEKWQRVSSVSTTGTSALRLRLPNIPNGTVTTLYSPVIDISSVPSGAKLEFDRAYARRLSTATDQLRIAFSADCGSTWSSNATISSFQLVSNSSAQPLTSPFVPTASEWRTSTLDVPLAYQGTPRLMVRIEAVANNGNYLYLDNFRVLGPQGTRSFDMAERSISVFPNPLTRETAVQFALDKATSAKVEVLDMLGRPVLTVAEKQLGAGQQRIMLQQEGKRLSAGVYVVQLTLGQERYTTRVLVQ